MRRLASTIVPLTLLALAACSDAPARGAALAPVEVRLVRDAGPDHFGTHATGDEEVPMRETPAQGQAQFKLSADETELSYRLNVSNLDNVVAAHIHVGPSGRNGPVVAFLYGPVAPNGGSQDGRLSEGTITAASLRGPLAGRPLSALVAQIRAGNTYVNVHTSNGTPTPAPGNFPGGEVRGQIDSGHGL